MRKGGFLVHRGLQRSEDETEIRVGERTGGTGREEYPSGDTAGRLAGDTARAATSDEVKDLRREASALKEVVAELTLENRLLKKKRDGGRGGRRMRYPASEKLEIIRPVEQSHLPVRRTLEKLGIPRATFYRWYGLYQRRRRSLGRSCSIGARCGRGQAA